MEPKKGIGNSKEQIEETSQIQVVVRQRNERVYDDLENSEKIVAWRLWGRAIANRNGNSENYHLEKGDLWKNHSK